jgi:hypothetical protein
VLVSPDSVNQNEVMREQRAFYFLRRSIVQISASCFPIVT